MSTEPSTPDPHVPRPIPNVDLFFGRVVVPVPNRTKPPKKGRLGLDYLEHAFIGDTIELTLANGNKVPSSDYKFHLENRAALTYGEINALAGDFYGTTNLISDGKTEHDRYNRFMAAFNTLAGVSPRQPKEAFDVLAVLQAEVDVVNKALENHENPSKAYVALPDMQWELNNITNGRYLQLTRINMDQFGEDARTAYNTGHAAAIQRAIGGDLHGAYTLNAFADHFLVDSFSAGHLRTPRRSLHDPKEVATDLCAELMHDEDCAVGLKVSNPAGESWRCFGGKRALDHEAAENLRRCITAVQASANEIFTVYSERIAPSPPANAAWKFAPTLDSARSPDQVLAPLFTRDMDQREDFKKRRVWKFRSDWLSWTTAPECFKSGWWNYPIGIDGPQVIISWSDISAVAPKSDMFRVFFQMPNGDIVRSEYDSALWWNTITDQPLDKALPFSPLASTSWDVGDEASVYYLDTDRIIRDCRYSANKDDWFRGDIVKAGAEASHNSRLCAIAYNDKAGNHIRVYYQEDRSNSIVELCRDGDGSWYKGMHLIDALPGTSLAAVTYTSRDQVQIRLYYQSEDLSLNEHCLGSGGWVRGLFNPGRFPGGTPISAVAFGEVEIQVYWGNIQGEIVVCKYRSDHWGSTNTVFGGLGSGCRFSLAHYYQGRFQKLFYQTADGWLLEKHSNDFGASWKQDDNDLKVGGTIDE